MRGTHSASPTSLVVMGIIPAHAGNTRGTRITPEFDGDHPRACGEHQRVFHEGALCLGSSPRMRGTHGDVIGEIRAAGIIPAHAGNTLRSLGSLSANRDHPRACGEHRTMTPIRPFARGSSPRMRGTQNVSFLCCSTSGIIPAHAGNTSGILVCLRMAGDHPRACGEHVLSDAAFVRSQGSSPRMRGTPMRLYESVLFRRDHPRACGEHWRLSG